MTIKCSKDCEACTDETKIKDEDGYMETLPLNLHEQSLLQKICKLYLLSLFGVAVLGVLSTPFVLIITGNEIAGIVLLGIYSFVFSLVIVYGE